MISKKYLLYSDLILLKEKTYFYICSLFPIDLQSELKFWIYIQLYYIFRSITSVLCQNNVIVVLVNDYLNPFTATAKFLK